VNPEFNRIIVGNRLFPADIHPVLTAPMRR